MKNKTAIICIILCCVMFLSSCGMFESFGDMTGDGNISTEESIENNTEANSYMTLTERQKSILRDEGLPEEYSELTTSQKSAIVAIEELLCYLEDKYDDEFTYEGYVSSLNFEFEPEHLTAYLGDPNDGKIVTVTRRYENKEYIYSDNYLAVVAEDEYKAAVDAHLATLLEEGSFLTIVDIDRINDSDSSVIARSYASVVIFIKNCFDSPDDAHDFVAEYGEWLLSQKPEYPTGALFKIQDEEDFLMTTVANHTDQNCKYFLHLSINGDGEMSIYE